MILEKAIDVFGALGRNCQADRRARLVSAWLTKSSQSVLPMVSFTVRLLQASGNSNSEK